MTGGTILSFHDWLVDLRRHFHRYPELAYKEEKTAEKIAQILGELGIPFRPRIGGTGILAALSASRPGPTIALRADMDALPLEEKTDVPFKSQNPGIMHACGHDGHLAIALGTARFLIQKGWVEKGSGKVLFIFQPAEEGCAGAKAMLDSGAFDAEQVEAVFAAHMHPELPAGQIGIARDVCNAAADSISFTITGKGGHAAHPHRCVDPIVAGAQLVTQIQSIVSRSVHPLESAVITIGKFHAGSARNIIPEQAYLEGTVRTLRKEVFEVVRKRLEELAAGLEKAHQVRCDFRIKEGYPVLVNDSRLVGYGSRMASDLLGTENVHLENPRMGAEDFSFFARRWTGMLIRLGCRKPGTELAYGLHSPWFDLDEMCLDVGVRLFGRILENYASFANHG